MNWVLIVGGLMFTAFCVLILLQVYDLIRVNILKRRYKKEDDLSRPEPEQNVAGVGAGSSESSEPELNTSRDEQPQG